MSPRKAAVAALALMASGISAIGAHSKTEVTVTAEPQFIGSTTSNGVLLYSFNLCTTVQSTTCAVTVSTDAVSASPEYTTRPPAEQSTTVTVTAPVSYPSQSENEAATSLAAGTVASDPPHWTPDPTVTQSASPDVSAPVTTTSPSVVVISTTDAAGSPTSLTSTISPAAHSTTGRSSSPAASVSSLSSGHSSGGRTTSSSSSSLSLSLSKTGGVPNATVTGTQEPSSASTAEHSAPSQTGAASTRVIPAMALSAIIFVTTMFII